VTAVLIALNILAGLFLIGVVLLQSGKGADMGAAFGGATSTVFGPSGAGNVLTKVTAATAAIFMATSLGLAVLSSSEQSVFDDVGEPTAAEIPAVPTPAEPLGTEDGPIAGGVNPNAAAEARGETPPAPLDGEAPDVEEDAPAGDAIEAPAGDAVQAPPGDVVEDPARGAVEAPAGDAAGAPAEGTAESPAGDAPPAPAGDGTQ
jgi:preprotein translocase subunit SecG